VCVCVISVFELVDRVSRNVVQTVCRSQTPQPYTISFPTAVSNNMANVRTREAEMILKPLALNLVFWILVVVIIKCAALV
jgi:hypothetical protein